MNGADVEERTPFLIVGAGPFGLAMAAWAAHLGIEHVVLGEPMGFWWSNMPEGMFLRSACDWHLDPAGEHTIERFLELRGQAPADVEPLSLALYREYARWFENEKGIRARREIVERLDRDDATGRFHAALGSGGRIVADRVLLAPGFRHFAHVPADLAGLLPAGRFEHTCDRVDLGGLRGRRVLVVGGRQSAFEWAALLREGGAAAVHVVHRHPTPAFAPSDWSWVTPLMEAMVDDPGWYRRLSDEERRALDRRFWQEGRLKLEPWLAPRVHADGITLWPEHILVGSRLTPGGALRIRLGPVSEGEGEAAGRVRPESDGGGEITVDDVIFATGYKVDLARLPYLAAGRLLPEIETRDGAPVLDETFQASVPGLHITSMPATRDFGAFFAFTVSVRTSARVIGRVLGS